MERERERERRRESEKERYREEEGGRDRQRDSFSLKTLLFLAKKDKPHSDFLLHAQRLVREDSPVTAARCGILNEVLRSSPTRQTFPCDTRPRAASLRHYVTAWQVSHLYCYYNLLYYYHYTTLFCVLQLFCETFYIKINSLRAGNFALLSSEVQLVIKA